jgi:hypothetical protein
MDTLEDQHLLNDLAVRELRSQLETTSASLDTLRKDFDHLIREHLVPIQSPVGAECSHCRIVELSYAVLIRSLFPNLGRILATGRIDAPILPGFEGGDERSSPSSSLPTLDSPSPCSDGEEYFSPPIAPNVSPIESEAESSDGSSGEDESAGEGVWEVLGGGGVREDSV